MATTMFSGIQRWQEWNTEHLKHIKEKNVRQVFNVSSHLEEEMMVEVCTGMDTESEDQSSVCVRERREHNVKKIDIW